MITTLATVETDSIRDWIEVFKRAPALHVDYVAQTPTEVISPTRVSLPHVNVIQKSIVVSDGTIVKGYRPYSDDGSKPISDVILASPYNAGATFSYSASVVTLRSPMNPYPELDPPLRAPRLIVLHGGTSSLQARREVNDDGVRVLRLKLMMTILIDTDDHNGGPMNRNNLLGTSRQVVEQSLDFLFSQGYENVVVESGKVEMPNKDGAAAIYRGFLLISCEVYPRVW